MTLNEGEWNAVAERIRARLGAESIHVHMLRVRVSPHPAAYNRIEVDVLTHLRWKVKNVLVQELGSDFLVDYHTHPGHTEQNTVYVFPADRAWGERSFRNSNVLSGRSYPRVK
jgi:hypothetical protein